MMWIENFRPNSLDEIIGQKDIVNFLKNMEKEGLKDFPHLLLTGIFLSLISIITLFSPIKLLASLYIIMLSLYIR